MSDFSEGERAVRDEIRRLQAKRRKMIPVLPIGLVAIGVFISAELEAIYEPVGCLRMPVLPMLTAAIIARTVGGVISGRIASALLVPIAIWFGFTPEESGLGYLIAGFPIALIAISLSPKSPARVYKAVKVILGYREPPSPPINQRSI